MKLIIAVLGLGLLIVVVIRSRRRAAAARSAKTEAIDLKATTSKFHAVAIRPGPQACDAALGLQGQRFLSEAAPAIPLPGCKTTKCQCRFVHFSDRRSGDERRSPYPQTIGMETGTHRQENRQPGDRRRDPPKSW